MIYDCFMFFNELDLLEFRLEYLNDVVDLFVIAEATHTHAGNPKPLLLKENASRFEKYRHKIKYLEVSFPEQLKTTWDKEKYQRRCLGIGLPKIGSDNDLVIVSDLDEFPDRESLLVLKNTSFNGLVGFVQYIFYFYINRLDTSRRWIGPGIASSGFMRSRNINTDDIRTLVRSVDKNYVNGFIDKGGWHFSWLGGIDNIKYKMMNYAHSEHQEEKFSDLNHIETALKDGKDIFREGVDHNYVVVTPETFPDVVVNNIEKMKKLGWIYEGVS
jgi:beta-1,4-mannosyl-glycoprotein beta-1,4-N-acetylglucosaminyltransferase